MANYCDYLKKQKANNCDDKLSKIDRHWFPTTTTTSANDIVDDRTEIQFAYDEKLFAYWTYCSFIHFVLIFFFPLFLLVIL